MEEFLKNLGITFTGTMSDDSYVIDLENSDQMARCYSLLDRSNEVEEDDDSSLFTEDNGSVQFESDDYLITITSDFNEDIYKLICKEK